MTHSGNSIALQASVQSFPPADLSGGGGGGLGQEIDSVVKVTAIQVKLKERRDQSVVWLWFVRMKLIDCNTDIHRGGLFSSRAFMESSVQLLFFYDNCSTRNLVPMFQQDPTTRELWVR